jgi:hypothetical protein
MLADLRDMHTDYTDEATLMPAGFSAYQARVFNEEAVCEAVALQVDDCFLRESARNPELEGRALRGSNI